MINELRLINMINKMKKLNFKLCLMLLVSLAFFFTSCSDDDNKGDGQEVDPSIRTRTFESADYTSGWKYFSFVKGDFVDLTALQAQTSLDWDVAFNRYYVKTNSGTSGKGKGGCIDSRKEKFAEVTTNINAEFTVDDSLSIMTTMGNNGKDSYNPEPVCQGSNSWAWYKYMESTWYYNHNVFIFRTANGKNCAKVIFDTYKDKLGNSGHITFRYIYDGKADADIDQPDQPGVDDPVDPTIDSTVYISSSKEADPWVYFSFKKGILDLTEAAAANSLEWDLAFQRYYIRTNSGTSGKGQGGAIDMNKLTFDEVPNVPKSGYVLDEEIDMVAGMTGTVKKSGNPAFKCSGSMGWAHFNAPASMTWSYNKNVFAIQTADGQQWAKIIMKNYKSENSKGNIEFEYVYPAK